MVKKKKRRVNTGNVLKVVAGFLFVLILLGVGILLFSPSTPEFLKSENKEAEVLKEKTSDVNSMVYYPQVEEPAMQTALQGYAENLLSQIMDQTSGYKKEDDRLLVKADYEMNRIDDQYVAYHYVVKSTEGDEYSYGKLFDLTQNQWVDLSTLLDETALKRVSAELRCVLKQNEQTKEAAYQLPMIEATAWDSGKYNNYYITEDSLEFYLNKEDVMNSVAVSVSVPMSVLQSHFNIHGEFPEEQPVTLDILPRVIDPSRPMIALTFDDGPHPVNTPEVLDILQRYDSAATFFMQGFRIERYPETTLMVANAASEPANHSYDHKKLTKLHGDALLFQLNKADELIRQMTGDQVTMKHFRPPYGAVNAEVKANATTPLIMWDVDTLDWKTRDPQSTIDTTLAEAQDGSIVLMHDIHAETVEAVRSLVPMLIEQGYQLVTVDELLSSKNVWPANGQKVFSADKVRD